MKNLTDEFLLKKNLADVIAITKFMAVKVYPLFDSYTLSSDRDVSIQGLYFRANAWMHSLNKLNNGIDVQAIVSGARSFLEITTYLILVYYDKTNESGWRMKCWGDSAKLKSAKCLVSYFNLIKEDVPDVYKDHEIFITTQEASIRRQRIALGWADAKNLTKDIHPERWTNRNLLLDVKKADEFHGSIIKRHLGSNLEKFYETEYRRFNWNVHGAELTGLRNLDVEIINLMCAFAYDWCVKLSIICIGIILQELKDKGMKGEIDNIIAELEYISVNLIRI